MSKNTEKVLLISENAGLGTRVCRLLEKQGIVSFVADSSVDLTPEAAFDLAFDNEATAVVLIEPLARLGQQAAPQPSQLRFAALRAARSPMVTGVGWVRSLGADEHDLLAEFRRRGTPYGELHVGPLLEVEVGDPARKSTTVLIDRQIAAEADQAGALALDQAAGGIAAWVAKESMREGGQDAVTALGRCVEAAVREMDLKPVVLPGWRVELNTAFGAAVLTRDEHRWRIQRRPLLSRRRRALADVGAAEQSIGVCA